MENNFDRESMEQQPDNNRENENRMDSIPLWLQGIADNNTAVNTDSEKNDGDEWQKEQTIESSEDTGPLSLDLTDQVLHEDAESQTSHESGTDTEPDQEDILPDWVSESKASSDEEEIKSFPGISSTPFDEIETKIEDDEENTEEVLLDSSGTPKNPQFFFTEEENIATPSEFVNEFSDPVEQITLEENQDPSEDELMAEDEEIPDWLREMIAADEKQNSKGQTQLNVGYSNDATQPVILKPTGECQPSFGEIATEQGDLASDGHLPSPDENGENNVKEDAKLAETPTNNSPPIRRAVMPTANWSRLTDLSDPSEESEENESDPEVESAMEVFEASETIETKPQEETSEVWEAKKITPEKYTDQFSGTGFKPIEFTPSGAEPTESDWVETEPAEESEIQEGPPSLEAFEAPAPVKHLEIPQAESTDPNPDFESDTPLPEESISEASDDLPSILAQAKQILDQGEVNQALPIIRSHISQAEHLEEIKAWLLEANDNIQKNKAEVWEALGDIASLEGDFSTALMAYAKAIDFLELARKNNE